MKVIFSFQNCPLISPVITDENLDTLDYISSIKVEKEPERISVIFNFEDNPFFENKQLRKDFTVNTNEHFTVVKGMFINIP